MVNPLLLKYAHSSVYDLFNDTKFIVTLKSMGYNNEFFVPETRKLSGNRVIQRNLNKSTKRFIRMKEVEKLLFYAGWRIGSLGPQAATFESLPSNYSYDGTTMSSINTGFDEIAYTDQQLVEGMEVSLISTDKDDPNKKIGLNTTKSPTSGTPNWPYEIYLYQTGLIFYTSANTGSAETHVDGTILKIQYLGGNISFYISNNGGANWTHIYSEAAGAPAYYVGINLQVGATPPVTVSNIQFNEIG